MTILPMFYHFPPTLTNFLSFMLFLINQKWFYFFYFSSSGMHQFHYLVVCQATGINSLLISFLHALCCLYLLQQAISLIGIIVSGLPSWEISSSRLILIRYAVLRPRWSLKHVTLSKSLTTTIRKSVVAGRLIRTLKSKIYKRRKLMIENIFLVI